MHSRAPSRVSNRHALSSKSSSQCHGLRVKRPVGRPSGLQALAGGGQGGIRGGGAYGGGGGGGGGGSDGGADDAGKRVAASGFLWQGWRDRVACDPEFPFKVFLEQVIGVGACVIGDMSSRPNWGLNELDFVFSTLVVGSIMNFALMYLLAPCAPAAAAGGAAAGGLLTRVVGDHYLRRWGAPGGNMFESGGFSAVSRLLNLVYKGAVFSTIGLLAGIFGTLTSNGLLLLRKKMDPSFEVQNAPPDVLLNALCWSAHMGVSGNLRYQLLGGLDKVLVGAMPTAVFRIYSTVIRTSNNVVGGISFVTLARIMGVQKSAEEDAPLVKTA